MTGNQAKIDKAFASATDAVIVDLEDALADNRKVEVRRLLAKKEDAAPLRVSSS